MADGALPPDMPGLEDETDGGWAARQLGQLQELAEIGMIVARTLPAQAETLADAEDPAAVAGQLALTFSRVSKAVRQTLALEAQLRQGLPRDPGPRPAPPVVLTAAQRAEQSMALARRRAAHKDQLRRAGRQIISDRALVADWDEQIEDLADEDEASFLATSISGLLAEICETLEVTPDWSLWRQEDWAIAELRDRPPWAEYPEIHDRMIAEGVWENPGGEADANPSRSADP